MTNDDSNTDGDTGMGVSSERTAPSSGLGTPKAPATPPEEPAHPKGAGRLHGYPKRRNHGD